MVLQSNIIFDNHYTLIRQLGRGGFSEVWLAHDSYMDLDVAIKIYAPGQGMDSNSIDVFRHEIKNIFHLNHPNLLTPKHLGVFENMPYLVMPYISSGSCYNRVGKMSEEEVWHLIYDVASGLTYLHDKDIVHQDIKPDNILINAEGNYFITDFGISTQARSTLIKSSIASLTTAGTIAYMGPERFSQQPAPTKASDIWSFGAMLFELLEGTTPFPPDFGGSMQNANAVIPTIKAHVSDKLKQTIYKMLSKETWDRPTAVTLVKWASNTSAIQIKKFKRDGNRLKEVLITLAIGCVIIFIMIYIFVFNPFVETPPDLPREPNYKSCDIALENARKHYAKGDYLNAKECYQYVLDECGPNYGAAAMWVKTCDEKELEAEEISVESIFSDNEYKDTLQEQEVNNVELFSKPDKLIFESYGGNKILTIESSSEYSITSTPRWISIEKINNNNKSVFVVAKKNSSSTDRIGFIHIKNEDGKTITVIIKQKCEIIQKKLAIDLGLSVKWATCNVGAEKPEDYGDYFAWGEIQEKETYNWKTYRYCNGTYINLKKYNTQNNYGIVDNKIKLEDKDDSAIANLGIIWRMPTKEEQDELRKCEWILTTRNGIKGYKIVGPNKNFIFLPAAGYMVEGKLYGEGNGYYWANSLYIDYPYRAYGISFSSTFISWNLFERCNGLPIRPVCK